jgi:hypothetical protein
MLLLAVVVVNDDYVRGCNRLYSWDRDGKIIENDPEYIFTFPDPYTLETRNTFWSMHLEKTSDRERWKKLP